MSRGTWQATVHGVAESDTTERLHFNIIESESKRVSLVSRVRLFATPGTVACQAPLSMGFSRHPAVEWVAIPSFMESSVHGILQAFSKACNSGVGCHSLLQGIFLTQGSNLGLLNCRQILYCLNYQGSSIIGYYQIIGFPRRHKW